MPPLRQPMNHQPSALRRKPPCPRVRHACAAIFLTCASGQLQTPRAAGFEGPPPTIWVSPEGNDAASGAATEPLRTFAAAQQRVRGHPERGRQPIHVTFAA
ncbi:MAG: hypothetical protein KDM81_19280, partial [Verrucomicrobiae bacterium]|nr:hypothetical protein [Verrucomicrobiae bacterium]